MSFRFVVVVIVPFYKALLAISPVTSLQDKIRYTAAGSTLIYLLCRHESGIDLFIELI